MNRKRVTKASTIQGRFIRGCWWRTRSQTERGRIGIEGRKMSSDFFFCFVFVCVFLEHPVLSYVFFIFIIIEKRIYSAANNSRLFTNLWNLQNMLALPLSEVYYSNFVKQKKERKDCSNGPSAEVSPPLTNCTGFLALTSTTWIHYILAECSR